MSYWWLLGFYPLVSFVLTLLMLQFAPRHDWQTLRMLFVASLGWGYLLIMILYDYVRTYRVRKQIAKRFNIK